MKIIPQLITFAVIVVLGVVTYYYYDPFRELVDDVSRYSDMMPDESAVSASPEEAKKAIREVVVQSEATTYTAVDKPETGSIGKKEAPPEKPGTEAAITPSDDVAAKDKVSEPVTAEVDAQPRPIQDTKQTQEVVKKEAIALPEAAKDEQHKEEMTSEQQALAGITQARSAWQQGDYEAAVKRYTELMVQFPNHPDFAGELGNIYYYRGQTTLAVDAYSEAFHRLIRMKEFRRAWNVLSYIRRIDYVRAMQLEQSFIR